jgi:hypothetical protein
MSNFEMSVKPASNFNWGLQGNLLITFASPGVIDPARFDEWIEAIKSSQVEYVLGAATGANTITSAQRKRVTETFADIQRISVVVDNRVTRGIFAALSWLGLRVKCHPWVEIDQACAFLRSDVATPDIIANLWTLRHATEQACGISPGGGDARA